MPPNNEGYSVEDARRYNRIRQSLTERDYIQVHRMLDIFLLEHAHEAAAKIGYYKDDSSITFDVEPMKLTKVSVKKKRKIRLPNQKELTPISKTEIAEFEQALEKFGK